MNQGAAILPPDLLKSATTLRLPHRATLFAQGDRPKAMYCVLSGEVRLVRTAITGAEIVLQRANGGFVAEASLDQSGYHCDAIVTKAATLLSIPKGRFQRALSQSRFRDAWIGYVSAQLRHSRLQCERLLLHTARERISHFIMTEGRDRIFKLAGTKKAWAAELGLTHEALYRTLRAMLESGELMERPAGSFRIKGV
ncbi:MAG: Crp/Fnr family transcriptional regulator [Xanthobacteraceae bacterium]